VYATVVGKIAIMYPEARWRWWQSSAKNYYLERKIVLALVILEGF